VAMRGLPALGLPGVPAPPRASVPDVVGLSRDEAVEILVDANFTPSATTVGSEQPAGTVVAQSPGGGTTATAGSVVTIAVSTGRSPSATVPNVVGLNQGQAASALHRAGFGVSVSYATTSSRSLSGTVKAQSPGSGTQADRGATVLIVVYRHQQPSDGGNPGGGGRNPGGGRGGNPGGERDGD
jgi:beta-lactam-binding protein with PASTA domain